MGEDANIPETVGWITFADGEETAVPTQAVLEHIREMNFSTIDSGILTPTHLGGGFVRLDVDIEAINTDSLVFDSDTSIPVEMGDPRDGLRPDVAYYVLFEFDEDQKLTEDPQDIDLLTCSPDALRTSRPDDWEIVPTPLVDQDGTEQTSDTQVMTATEEDGTEKVLTFADFDTDPQKLVSIYSKEKERYLTLKDLVGGLTILQAAVTVALRMRERRTKREYRRRKGTNVTTHALDVVIDPLTNALTDGKTFKPQDYFSGKPVKVNTGNGGHALLTIYAGDDVDIDAAYSAYGIDDRTRFWLDPLYKLAYEGHTVITGSDLLKANRITNPYKEESQGAMRDALENITKATSTRILVDLSHEKRNQRRGNARIINSAGLRSIVGASIDLDTLETENGEVVRDFTINLLTKDGNVGDALPLAEYARSRGMLTTVSEEDSTFTGMRVDLDQRQMWRYVLRRIQSKTLSGTILFSTMWDILDVEDPDVSEWEDPAAVRAVDKQIGTARESLSAYEEEPPEALVAEIESLEARREELTSKRASDTVISRRRADAVRKKRERMLTALEKMLDQKKGILFKSWSWHKDADGKVDGIKIVRNK